VGAGIGLAAGLALGSIVASQYSGDEPNVIRAIVLVPAVVVSTLVGALIGTGDTFQLTSPPP
ncbi:MAG TPA: hypothetical protein VFP52_16755, partial [Myxococcales bacterium]|nr:hypothetical protein [Myxococcales bacterium]